MSYAPPTITEYLTGLCDRLDKIIELLGVVIANQVLSQKGKPNG